MISIYNDLDYDERFDFDDHINKYTDKYLKMNKDYNYYYQQYDDINKIDIKTTLKTELELDKPEIYDFKSEIKTHFIKSCLLESLKKVIKLKSSDDKKLFKRIKKYKKKFNYYPEINDYKNYDDFLIHFSRRKEFNIHQIPKNKNKICEKSVFELQPHQLFLKNLLSRNTPYNGLLIFHGVGVGKTCSGISIAENFKDTDKKIIVLAPEKIQEGWKKNIYNPDSGPDQCTADTYIDEEDKYAKNKGKLASNKIKEYYEMFGYLAFSNMVKKYLIENLKHIPETDLLTRKSEEIKIINEKFSNCVLIIDEVHKIRTDNEDKASETLQYIEKIITHASNLKLILLTANPMFNQPDEIIWILNMLLINDNCDKIDLKTIEYLDKDGDMELSKKHHDILYEKSKGYVSYLRGENPYTFPYRLYPQKNICKEFKKDIFGEDYLDKPVKFLELYGSNVTKNKKQYNVYYNELLNLGESDSIPIDVETKLLQLSNCVYPVDSDNIEDVYGENGINNCFNKLSNKYTYKKNIPNFLDLDLLRDYSSKIYSIITEINNSEGIVFIYSNFLAGGILPLVLALEQNGYAKYDGKTVLKSNTKRDPINYKGERGKNKIPAKYMVVAGNSLKMTNDFKKELKIVTDPDNSDGSNIKIIIGSSVAAEGLDFKNIRAIHLLEPWHNINKLEQVIGRGIRNCSHAALTKEKQNITIYFHTCVFDDREGIETYLYRRCEKKSIEIGLIEVLLKKVAIDKYLFQNANLIKKKDVSKVTFTPAHRKETPVSVEPYDKPNTYTRSCSFLADCDYFKGQTFNINEDNTLTGDTFSIKYSQSLIDVYKRRIKDLIVEFVYLDIDTIISKLAEKLDNILEEIIYHSIDQMINDKYVITLGTVTGYLKYSDNYYYFQPAYNDDIFITTYDRLNQGLIDFNDYRLLLSEKTRINIPEIQIFTKNEIETKYDEIIDLKLSTKEECVFDMKIVPSMYKYSYIIDRLKFKDKCILIYSVISHLLNDIELDEKYSSFITELITILSPLFIYYNEEISNYEWTKEYDKTNITKLYGCFLYFHERKEYHLFSYEGNKLILCNEIDKNNILSYFSKIPKKTIYNTKSYSYIEYNKNYKITQNGLVLKIKKEKDKKGSIFLSSSSSEWTYENGIKFIEKKYPNDWSAMTVKNKKIYKNQIGIKKLTIGVLIEIIMRKNNNFINGDLLWLFTY